MLNHEDIKGIPILSRTISESEDTIVAHSGYDTLEEQKCSCQFRRV